MRVTIDRDGCIGCGLCESICPEVFKLDEEGKAYASEGNIDAEYKNGCLSSAKDCPVSVIKII